MGAKKLTEKYQTTIPAEIRKFLGLKKGDFVTFQVEEGKVVMRKVNGLDVEYLESVQSTLSEWNSEYDDEAYDDL